MGKLYDTAAEIERVSEMLEDPEVEKEDMLEYVNGLGWDFAKIAEQLAMVVREKKGEAAALKVEKDRIAKKEKRCWDSVEWIQGYIEECMRIAGMQKFKTDLFSFGIQKNPASVVIDHPELVPEAYIVPQEPKFDKAAIKDLLNSGDAVACHFAHMEQSEGLRIR